MRRWKTLMYAFGINFCLSTATGAATKALTVYTSHESSIVNPIIRRFQETSGIKVELVYAGTGELLRRIRAESKNPAADVLWGGGVESLDSYREYFRPYTTAHDSVIPAAYKESGHHWTGFTVLPMVIFYNTALVKGTEIPDGWGDLLRPSYKGTIAFADPIKSGSSYTIAVTLLTVFGRDDGNGWKFLKEFIANLDGKILSGSTAVPKGVADGEYRIGLTLEESALRYALSGAPVALVYPAEGTTAVADGSAIVRVDRVARQKRIPYPSP
ncbi:MAG: extracellular solute-binding protein [Chitinivibrionales bacterium]|nr:extracellular solute-binding protein [Chitinivibrionales bacterium]